MSLFAFTLIMIAVFSHAGWNFIVKSSTDRLGAMVMMLIGIALAGFALLPFVTIPKDPQFWTLVGLSVAFHLAYQVSLLLAYRYADFSVAYPIARGAVPLLVLAFAYYWADQLPTPVGIIGVVWVALGIMALAFFSRQLDFRGVLFAGLTSVWIAGYTVVDGSGVRLTDQALAFVALSFASHAIIPLIAYLFIWKRRLPDGFLRTYPAAIFALLAYAPVLWAQRSTDFAAVSSLRETSVIVASLLGVFILKEGQARLRIGAAIVVCFGAALIVLA